MKITLEPNSARQIQPPLNPLPSPDLPILQRKPPRRKTKTHGGGVRLRRESRAPSVKRSSRPETPLLSWKFNESNAKNNSMEEDDFPGEVNQKSGRKTREVVSARKLAAGLWRLRLTELQSNVGHRNLGLKFGIHVDRVHSSPKSVCGPLLHKFQHPEPAMEGATKWDPDGWKASDVVRQIFGQPKPSDHVAMISALEAELERARSQISHLQTERTSSKKKLEHFLQKLSEERTVWRSREHDKIRSILDDMKSNLTREKKNRHRLEIANSKLVNELGDAKLSAKRYLQEYEKERKAREIIEEVCNELAKEIGEDKDEAEELKRESFKLREEVEEERKMLQMAEVWREERAQMKLIDAKVMLEEKYSHMKKLVSVVESFINSTCDLEEGKKAEFLRDMADSVNIQDVRELTYEPPSSDDIYSVLEDVNNEECSNTSKRVSKESVNWRYNLDDGSGGEVEDDVSEWETVSHPEDEGSSYSPDGSDNHPQEWRSLELGNHPPMKEWPRISSFKARLRMESQNIQLRQVLKHRI